MEVEEQRHDIQRAVRATIAEALAEREQIERGSNDTEEPPSLAPAKSSDS